MKIVECSGTPRQIGGATGEALREEIHQHIAWFPMRQWDTWQRRVPVFLKTLELHLPHVLEEMRSMAAGADVPAEEILRLNLPLYPDELTPAAGCSNIVFAGGEDGPIWGKNNDGGEPHRPVCARLIRPAHGIPQVTFTFCGMIATTDGMNAEGVAVGHSSVGSIFQQSDHHVPIRLWAYDAMRKSRTVGDFVRLMTSTPLRGKGYSIVCVDREGMACSLEAPCPLVQVRRPSASTGIHCVNCYQLPMLHEADRRSAAGKRDAHGRWRFLDRVLTAERSFNLEHMQSLLRHHDGPGLCRHGEGEGTHTEYSMIGLPAQNRLLYLEGYPCENEYAEILL